MKVPPKWIFTAAAIVLVAGGFFGTSVSYTADCIRCLHQVRGSEKHLFGVRVWHSRSPARDPQATVGGIELPTLPVGRSSTFVQILDAACDHELKRDGFGRSPLLGGGVGCGGYAEGRAFAGRRYALSALDHLYARIPDLALAKQSYAVIERIFPHSTSLERAMSPHGPNGRVLAFAATLNLAASAEEWRSALNHFETTSSGATLAAVRPEPNELLVRLRSADPSLRRTAANLVVAHPALDEPRLWRAMLSSDDNIVVGSAATSILANRRFEYFSEMLRSRKPASDDFWLTSFTDSEIDTLLRQDDRAVDNFCFLAIAAKHRLRFADQVVARLDKHDTHEARQCVDQLIAGPNPLDGGKDAWDRIEPLAAPRSEILGYLEVGAANKRRDARKWQFLNAVKAFSLDGTSADWPLLQATYLREANAGISETYCAVMAKGLMLLDPERTRAHLVAELAADNHQRQVAALAGMGLIADPAFADVIDRFEKNQPAASPTNPYSAAYIFHNPYYARFIEYARHRCRGVHLWRLVKDADGRYELRKSEI